MKIIKTYKLSEDNLEKDIDQFIKDAENGAYQFDYKYGQEGLKLIKVYFRMIEEEFKNQNYAVSRACYKKLMFLLLQSEYNYLGYEDIVGKMNFNKFLANYFICVIKLGSTIDLLNGYIEYLNVKKDYYFEFVHKTIFTNLSEDNLKIFVNLVENKAKNLKKDDYELYDLIYFLLDLARFRKNKEEFNKLCERYKGFVDKDELFNEDD